MTAASLFQRLAVAARKVINIGDTLTQRAISS